MILDAQTFELSLTPEIALSIIQKGVMAKGWKKYEIAGIKLVYTPFYVFSFDIAAESQAPSGKAALNAYTSELNDFVPVLLDRPLKRMRNTAEKTEAEVEPTAVGAAEAKDVAMVKVAAFTGVPKDRVSIAAVVKMYVPFFRIWVNVANDTYKIDVDASLGAPAGLEAIPARPKGWEEATSETIQKMKSPEGWVELGGKTVQEAGKVVAGGGKVGLPKVNIQMIAIIAVIVLLAYLFISRGGVGLPGLGGTGFACAPNPEYVKAGGFLSSSSIVPEETGGVLNVDGYCNFTNPSSDPSYACVKLGLKADGKQSSVYKIVSGLIAAQQTFPRVVPFSFNWTSDKVSANKYELTFEKCG